ncbi:ABC transporter substrate-binding protein [Anaeromyxobacter paludicola]|uniref:Solute-binding protein family 3/N-terminal domain-containing protein n=1 Tax=Anaeromyxobacter paludicola TaxID=2918171 RepID=A0ABN6NBB6_9BACT|nr:ABC transporter substrate-binding protein [Anaeromyxobacter paludicola]BDG10538.1 hypothetical protein AMPC_36510 [Anaeromyxobacter paludicola]
MTLASGERGSPARRLATLALVLLAACRPGPPPSRPLVLGAPTLPSLGLLDVARFGGERGRAGARVERRAYQSGRAALDALLAGQVDLAACYDMAFVVAALSHPELRVLTSLHHASAGTVIVTRRGGGVARPEDLRGRRVGVPRDTSADFFLETLLRFAGVPTGEVERVDLAPEAAAAALARGEVAAVAIWYPQARKVREALPPGEALEITSDVHTEVSMLVVRADVLAARDAEVRAVVRALSEAEWLVQRRPDEAFAALRRAFPGEREDDLREDWARARPELGLRNAMLAVLEREARWVLRERGRPGPGPDFRELFAQGPLTAADPEAVTVYPALPPPLEEGDAP